jgi:GTP pyrophosphokinase
MATALKEIIPGWDIEDEPTLARLDPDLLARAYRFSEQAHLGQKRSSGDDYVSHCVEVAKILAELHLDTVTVASGLIHDVVEDTSVTVQDVERAFGKEIAQIVDGVTKIGNISFRSTQERQVENYRKLLLSIAKDVRVILIKLADRLHNMRTLDYLPEEKRRRIAQETMDLYAPMAHRFGMAKVRWELEDLSFKYIEPAEYKALAKLVSQKRAQRETLIRQLAEPLDARLKQAEIANVEVTGRPKHLWSIYKKMRQRDKPYEEIYDLLAIRVLVRAAEVEWLPVAAHDRVRPGSAALRDPDPDARDAPDRGVRYRGTLAVQGEPAGGGRAG